jgi:restriction system protein
MSIPDYQSIMLPMLRQLADGAEHPLGEVREALAAHFGLTPGDRDQLLASGNQGVFENRVGWARTYLKKAGLLEYVKRGVLRITPRGLEVLAEGPPEINVRYLDRFPEFQEFRRANRESKSAETAESNTFDTPDETIEAAYQQLRNQLTSELLEQIRGMSWQFFERLVVDLLVKMGYGGSRKEAGQAFQQSGDEGIDGIIKEDRLGLDIIYVQAKRWKDSSTVGRPEIQKFAGALQGKRARKGVFITTSSFSREALDYAGMIESKIILIDGDRLADLMLEHGVGVTTTRAYEIKKMDLDYFTEE